MNLPEVLIKYFIILDRQLLFRRNRVAFQPSFVVLNTTCVNRVDKRTTLNIKNNTYCLEGYSKWHLQQHLYILYGSKIL